VSTTERAPDDSHYHNDDREYEAARKRVEAKRNVISHLVTFVVVNTFLIGVWAATGRGYFWPAWIIGPWAIGVVLHIWDAFFRRPITDQDVRAELERGRH
jgi:hypothetical protein